MSGLNPLDAARKCEGINWAYRIRCSREQHSEGMHLHWSPQLGTITWFDELVMPRTGDPSEGDILCCL